VKLIAAAIVLAGLLIGAGIAFSAYEDSKPKTHCFKLRVANDPVYGGSHDVIRCVKR
jgi:hypothetical protein